MKLTDGDNTYTLGIGASVGSETGTQGRVYVKATVYQDAIYTVSEDIYNLLNKSVFDLRDKRVTDFQRTDTIRFEIKQETETTVGTRNFDNIWELQTPTGKIKADADAVSDLLFGVDSLEAAAFIDNSTQNLASYAVSITINQGCIHTTRSRKSRSPTYRRLCPRRNRLCQSRAVRSSHPC